MSKYSFPLKSVLQFVAQQNKVKNAKQLSRIIPTSIYTKYYFSNTVNIAPNIRPVANKK
jgi:hypothetical protein